MSTASNSLTRLASLCAMGASAALAVYGIIQITDEQSSQTTVVGIEHVTLAALTTTLLLLLPMTLLLGRIAWRPRFAAFAMTGMSVLAALTVVSNVRGEDPSFFAAVAIPSNVLWFGGWVALAVALKRSGRVPAAVAIGLPITWVLSLPLSQFGASIIAAAYWLVVAWLVAHGELARPREAVAAA
jgi:hypothetical protein